MPKKIAPLVSQFCRRKHNENESEVVYPQIIFKSSDLLEQFDLSGYPTINISCSVSRNVKECREHGYHCVYLSNKHLEALSIFEGDWVCIVVGNREKKNIISCHVASAHLLPGEQKLSSNQIDDNNNGISGLEKSLDEKLKKTKDPIVLSIDADIQHLVREELKKFNQIFQVLGSAAILMNVHLRAVTAG